MLEDYEKFRMIDEDGKHDFFIEVNWKPESKKTNECKILKVTFPNRDICYLKKEHLNTLLFVIGNEAEQRKMIPQKISEVKWYETVLSIKNIQNIFYF